MAVKESVTRHPENGLVANLTSGEPQNANVRPVLKDHQAFCNTSGVLRWDGDREETNRRTAIAGLELEPLRSTGAGFRSLF